MERTRTPPRTITKLTQRFRDERDDAYEAAHNTQQAVRAAVQALEPHARVRDRTIANGVGVYVGTTAFLVAHAAVSRDLLGLTAAAVTPIILSVLALDQVGLAEARHARDTGLLDAQLQANIAKLERQVDDRPRSDALVARLTRQAVAGLPRRTLRERAGAWLQPIFRP